MNLNSLSKHYQVKRITEETILDVLQLCEGNPIYYEYCPPKPSVESIKEDLKKLPPNKKLDDKFYIGFYDKNKLVAVMDFILAFPNVHTLFIGFFMVDKDVQGKGIGKLIISEVLDFFKYDFSFVRLGYVLGNQQSERFWKKQQFVPTGVVAKEEAYSVVVLERKLEV